MKKYTKHLLVLIFFLSWAICSQAYAGIAAVFKDCTIQGKKQNDDSGTNNKNNVVSSIYSAHNKTYCDNICNTRFAAQEQNVNMEINANLISECLNLCMDKVHSTDKIAYTAAAKRAYPGQETNNVTDPQTHKTYSTTINYSIYKYEIPQQIGVNTTTDINIKPSDKYFSSELKNDSITTIKLDSSATNVIYACGHKVITLEPMFPNMFQMSPDTVSGGDSERNSIDVDYSKVENTKTNATLKNPNYAGTTDFDYNQYVQSFGRKPEGLDEMLQNLFCDSYAQDITMGDKPFNCATDIKKYNLDPSYCNTCIAPDACATAYIKVRNGKMSADDCKKNSTNNKYDNTCCDVSGYILDSSIINKYSGIQKVNIDKSFFYRNGWSNSTSTDDKSTEWTSETVKYHPCLSTKASQPSNSEVTDINKNSPNYNYSSQMTISVDNYPEKVGCYPQWHLYNTNYLDTGIIVSDDDFLSISWGGNIILGNGLNTPFIDQSLAKALTAGDNSAFAKFSNSPVAQKMQKLKILQIMSTLAFDGLDPLVGEGGDIPQNNSSSTNPINPDAIDGEICNKKTIYDLRCMDKAPWYGLTGNINRKAGTPINGNINAPCSERNILGDTYQYSGHLSGLGKEKPLKIRHLLNDSNSGMSDLYQNSIISGGYQVSIEWGGCPMKDGKGLEIALGNSDSKDEDLQWIDISSKTKAGYTLAPKDQGMGASDADQFFDSQKYSTIFMRVNTSAYNVPQSGDFNTRMPYGAYKVSINTISKASNNALCDKVDLTKIIAKEIFKSLIGDPANITNGNPFEGLIINLSNAIRYKIIDIVQVALVLYVTLSGLGFLIGTIQMTQKEFVSRFVKASFVIMILFDSSWDWLLQNYIRLFIVGSLKLASIFNNIIYEILYKQFVPNDLFDLFRSCKYIMYLTEGNLMYRIIALSFSSLPGLVIGFIILFGVITSGKVIIEAIFIYISAILTQGLLILVAPFFIVLKLFKQTEAMFDDWFKQVMLFSIIPAAVAISVNLFLLLLQIGLDATMGFSYCMGCQINIFGICFVPGFFTLGLSFLPSGSSGNFLLPAGIVSGALTFLFIVEIGAVAVKSTLEVIGRIISFKAEAAERTDMTGLGGNLLASAAQTPQVFKSSGAKDTTKRISDEKKLKDVGKKLDKIKP